MTELDRFAGLRCVVLGGYVADCIIQTATLPSWDNDVRAQSIAVTPGGKAANQAVALARMGAQVSAVGLVGGDAVGTDVLDHLQSNGVGIEGVHVKPAVVTPVCLVLNGKRGQKSITWHISEELEVSARQIQQSEALIAEADVVLLTFELPPAAINEALSVARQHHKKVVLNAAPYRTATEIADTCFDGVSSLVVNELEARSLFGHPEQPECESALVSAFARRHGIELVCLTRGARGCSYWHADQLRHQPSLPVAAQNSAGAGDAFTATLALYQAAGYNLSTAIRAACAAGSLAVEARERRVPCRPINSSNVG